MNQDKISASLRRPLGSALTRWAVAVVALFLLSGCVVPLPSSGQIQTLPPAESVTEPIIAVAPDTIQPGEFVSVAGAGWDAKDTIFVNLEFQRAGELIALTVSVTTTGDDGAFAASFFAPDEIAESDNAELTLRVRAVNSTDEVTAPLTLAGVTPGTTVTATATAATATATATPLSGGPTATPTATAPTSGGAAFVTSAGLNLRSGPGSAYAILRSLVRNDELSVLGQSYDSYWLYVRVSDGVLGWVARPYTSFTGNAPIVQPPPQPPQPTATRYPGPTPTATPGAADTWRGEYYANRYLNAPLAFVRDDAYVDFDWGSGAPGPSMPWDNFSVRWTRTLYFEAATYRFRALVDDGVRVYVDDQLIIDDWRDDIARERTGDKYLGAGYHYVRVEYYEHTGDARIRLTWDRVNGQDETSFPDWKGEYWTNRDLDGDRRFARNDSKIDFNWGDGSPDGRIPDDNFSVRWTRERDFDRGLYRFYARADDGVRVWVDGDRIINEWRENDYSDTYSADVFLDGDTDLRVEYFERNGGARIHVWWEKISDEPAQPNPFTDVNPTSGQAGTPVVVTGGGFPANTPIYVYLGGIVRSSRTAAPPQRYATGFTDGNGSYRIPLVIPITWPDGSPVEPGDLTVVVATDGFVVEGSDIFTVQAQRPPSGSAPYANVNPASGGVDTPVIVSGGGFPANVRVNAHLARVVSAERSSQQPAIYASATTDGLGNFSMSFTIPREWKDTNDTIDAGKLLIVVATDGFGVTASASFDYFVAVPRPSLNMTPSRGGAGTAVAVSGGGFPANRSVGVYLGVFGEQIGRGNAQRYAAGGTDGNGNYSMAFSMPATWPDGSPVTQEQLVVLVATDDFSVQVGDTFTYIPSSPPPATPTPTATPLTPPTATPQPSLSIGPNAGGGNTIVNASGGGFPANSPVAVYLASFDGSGESDGRNQQYGNAVTDGNGNYAISFIMPREWPNGEEINSGRVVVMVATTDFQTQATAIFSYVGTTAASGEVAPAATATATETSVPPTATVTPSAASEPATGEQSEPTNTPTTAPPTATETAAPSPTDTATPEPPPATATDTATPIPPTATDTPTPAPPTETETPIPSPTATATLAPPTATDTETPVPPPTDTAVPEPPTATEAPTETPTEAASAQEPPPLAPLKPVSDTVK